ncbi:MAG: ABC transporter ATP-binding protein [Chloroflexi bacterium]|nr:MAG: ABC transporter ATP-binding protein [Chloroflexota bacterium]TMG34637.1 MAG: ABC transporter ATP-binding protein [Chloroflexota bacterium]TMG35067.1 MAG: ABC transporter ATP-binding protein [Chloroflexota bacterium]
MADTVGVKLEARGVTVHYRRRRSEDHFLAVDRADLEVGEGEFVCIVGPSGCGKTTFLNAVDGLLPLTGGSLVLDGRAITGPGPDRALVFQQPSLLPWRTVLGNVIYGVELRGAITGAEARERAQRHIELVGLKGFEDSFPSELSGGMQQRVNLARALTTDPEVLLLDEPFGALDAQTRETMQLELLRIWNQTRKTAIFITHDIVEAVYLADRVIVFTARPGRVKMSVPIGLPRPRDLRIKREPRFLEYELKIWESIREEVMRSNDMEERVA